MFLDILKDVQITPFVQKSQKITQKCYFWHFLAHYSYLSLFLGVPDGRFW